MENQVTTGQKKEKALGISFSDPIDGVVVVAGLEQGQQQILKAQNPAKLFARIASSTSLVSMGSIIPI